MHTIDTVKYEGVLKFDKAGYDRTQISNVTIISKQMKHAIVADIS